MGPVSYVTYVLLVSSMVLGGVAAGIESAALGIVAGIMFFLGALFIPFALTD